MNRLCFAIMLIGILSFSPLAQKNIEQAADRPTFTGTWEIENKESNPLKNQTLIINQAGDQMSLTESFEYKGKLISNQTTLYSDKRGEQNLLLMPGADFAVEVKSTTSWKKDKLIRNLTFSTPFMSGANRYTVVNRQTQTYRISKDGNALTVETTDFRENPLGGSPTISYGKRVYCRKK